ncbi:hypothetical protein MTO96_044645 [Rhipicephalus appendiculatus]
MATVKVPLFSANRFIVRGFGQKATGVKLCAMYRGDLNKSLVRGVWFIWMAPQFQPMSMRSCEKDRSSPQCHVCLGISCSLRFATYQRRCLWKRGKGASQRDLTI